MLVACDDGGATAGRGDAGRPDAGVDDADSGTPSGDAGATDGDAGATDGDSGTPEGDAGIPAPDWFETRTPFALTLEGAFGDAFAAAHAGEPDGIFPPTRLKDPFPGTARYAFEGSGAQEAVVTLAVRGNSSLQECVFPKLKLEFEARRRDPNDPLRGTKKLKLGTHCGEDSEVNGTIGRFCNELSSWREELVYQLARALGIVTLETRPATVTYEDVASASPIATPLTRKAMLLEHVDELARRLGATALKDPVDCGDTTARPDPRDVLRVKMFHAMVGNWDFGFGSLESGGCDRLWNAEVLVHGDGALTLVPADFDLAAMVVGKIERSDDITQARAEAYARENLTSYLEGESAEQITAMKAEFVAQRAALKQLVADSLVDDAGKANARTLLDAFFTVLAE